MRFILPTFRRKEENNVIISESSHVEGWVVDTRISNLKSQSLADERGNPHDKFLFFREPNSVAQYRRTEALRKLQHK
jgi:hypothetical protein